MKGLLKFVGALFLISMIYNALDETPKKTVSNQSSQVPQKQIQQDSKQVRPTRQIQPTQQIVTEKTTEQTISNNTKQEEKTEEDNRLFRYKQCEENHSEDYCRCFIGHVKKQLGFMDSVAWLSGGGLTDANAIKALNEAYDICSELDREYREQKLAEREKQEKIAQEKREDKKNRLLSYNQDFCNLDSFRNLMDSRNEYKKDEIELPVDDIELVELSGEKFCKVAFRCSWCGTDNITTQLFFKRTTAGKLEFDVNQGTDATNTLYFLAVWINNPETVKDLISKGADVNYKYKADKDSFFTRTIGIGSSYFDIVKVCVENGANIYDQYTIVDNFSPTIYKETPLMKAINGNDIKSAELLLQKGVDVNMPMLTIRDNGETTEMLPIERIIPVSNPEWLKLLLKYGAKIPEYGYVEDQKMPLIWAVMLDNPTNLVERLELWLSHGADVNAEYKLTRTISIRDTDGKYKFVYPEYKPQKPIEYAEKNNMSDVVLLLQKYGAKPAKEVVDLRWCNTQYGKQICGTFINNTDSTLKNVYITFNLYDLDGAIVDETLVNANYVGPGEKWKFKTTGSIGPEVKSYKIQEIVNYDY